MTLLFIPRAGCASKPRLPRRTGRPPGALPPASVLLIMGAGAGAEVALRARPLPAWQPLLGQLHGEAASESLGTLTPGPCCDPAYPTPPPPPAPPLPSPCAPAAKFQPRHVTPRSGPLGGGGVGDRSAVGRARGGTLVGLHPWLFLASAMTVESPFGILSIWQCHGAGVDL